MYRQNSIDRFSDCSVIPFISVARVALVGVVLATYFGKIVLSGIESTLAIPNGIFPLATCQRAHLPRIY